MAGIAHFQVEDGRDFFVSGHFGLRPIRGTTIYRQRSALTGSVGVATSSRYETRLMECASTELAEQVRNQYVDSRSARMTDLNIFFDRIEAPWALVGSPAMTVIVPTSWSNDRWTLRHLKSWITNNCSGETCILSGTYKRRVSFANEDDYILAMMTFTGAKLF